MEQSLVEWLQGTFENLKFNDFNALYDGEVQLQVLNQIEPGTWDATVSSRRTSTTFSSWKQEKSQQQSSRGLLSRADRVRNFKYMAECAATYFQSRNENSIIPINFVSTQIDQLVDMHSQKALLVTIDLITVVMLNSENSESYIQRIMNLSEQAQDEMQKVIMRSKNNLDDLISSQQSQSEYKDTFSPKYMANDLGGPFQEAAAAEEFGIPGVDPIEEVQSMKSDLLRPDLLEAQSTGSMNANLLIADDDF